MNKSIPALLLALTLITGCGGGSSNETEPPPTPKKLGQYNLWEYIVPKTATTKSFVEIKEDTTQSYKTTYSISPNKVIGTADYTNETTIYSKKKDIITVSFTKDGSQNGTYDLHLTADINDIVTVKESTCKLEKHHKNIQINDKTFTDVIEIKCNDKPGYYQKGVGEVAQTQLDSRSIRILSN